MGSVSERRYASCCQDKTEDVDRGRDAKDTEVVATLLDRPIVLRATARTINLTRTEGDIWERDRKEVPRGRLAPSNAATKGDESTTRANIEAKAQRLPLSIFARKHSHDSGKLRHIVHSHPNVHHDSERSLIIR